MNRENFVIEVARVEARCTPRPWPWAEENRAAIAENWERRRAITPKLFNGRVLVVADYHLAGDVFRADFFEVDYAGFLAWIDSDFADETVANGFAMGALQGSDGAYVLGEMAAHTANAGKVYFPAGTPDLSDLRPDGRVDLAASVTRELREETGLTEADLHIADRWIVVKDGALIAFMRPLICPEPGEAVRTRILENLAAQPEPELAAVRLARSETDIDERAMQPYLKRFLRWAFRPENRTGGSVA